MLSFDWPGPAAGAINFVTRPTASDLSLRVNFFMLQAADLQLLEMARSPGIFPYPKLGAQEPPVVGGILLMTDGRILR